MILIFFIVIIFSFYVFWIFACFVNCNINTFNNFPKSFIITLISFTSGRVTKENAFICYGFKLAKFFINPFDVTFASKNFEVFYSRSLNILKFMWSLIVVYSNIFLVENSDGDKCNFTQKSCRSSRFIYHSTSHFLNSFVHPLYHSILLRSPFGGELPFYSMLFTKVKEFI